MSLIRLDPPVDEDEYEILSSAGLSDYERIKIMNQQTHFSLTRRTEGRYKGFDKVTYYRKKL